MKTYAGNDQCCHERWTDEVVLIVMFVRIVMARTKRGEDEDEWTRDAADEICCVCVRVSRGMISKKYDFVGCYH